MMCVYIVVFTEKYGVLFWSVVFPSMTYFIVMIMSYVCLMSK